MSEETDYIETFWGEMQSGKARCVCCDTLLVPRDSIHIECSRCGLKFRFKNGAIQIKGNMMEDYK